MNNSFNELIYSKEMPVDGIDKIRIDFILNNIEDNNLEILDIGCWDGSYAIRYKKKTNTIYGIESSISASKKASKKGIIVEYGNFMEKNFFKGRCFDIIVAGEIIEHVFDTDLFLKKIKKMLKKNGKLILTTPNVASLPRRILLFLGMNPILENRVIEKVSVGHIRYFTFKEINNILKDNGFTPEKYSSDVVNFNNSGTLYSKLIPKLHKEFGKTIMVCSKNI